MNKDKLTDPRENNIENNIENKKEDYTDSNGNTEDFIEDMTDLEATDIFKKAFYAEGKALEEEALRSPFVEDEEKKEALRLRILAAAGSRETDTASADRNEVDDSVTAWAEDGKKKKKRRFTPFMRWAAALALVCLGVFGVSVTGQARGSGLWSSIQRLIGGETRWEQENNGEDRNISNPDEYKAIGEIEEELGINVPKFFYWPEKLDFSDVYIFEESNSFLIRYMDGKHVVYFEGWQGDSNISSNNTWKGKGEERYLEYDGISYTIIEAENEEYGLCYYVRWTNDGNKFALSGMESLEEVENILKNIKN